jgi:hypothetical protein
VPGGTGFYLRFLQIFFFDNQKYRPIFIATKMQIMKNLIIIVTDAQGKTVFQKEANRNFCFDLFNNYDRMYASEQDHEAGYIKAVNFEGLTILGLGIYPKKLEQLISSLNRKLS